MSKGLIIVWNYRKKERERKTEFKKTKCVRFQDTLVTDTWQDRMYVILYVLCVYDFISACVCLCACATYDLALHTWEYVCCTVNMHSNALALVKRSDRVNGKSLLMSGQRCSYITFMWHVAYIYYYWGQETENSPSRHPVVVSCQVLNFVFFFSWPHRGSPLSYSHLSDRCNTARRQWHKWVVQPANQQRVFGQWKQQ